ncbi:MAG: LysE family translocator [Dysgonamonadaceae bacterium]|jgi:threonine/homoserine/homoserine lactone efflux protein|nr:LysE family translocator [Dysgonamonadaceae bacterium]
MFDVIYNGIIIGVLVSAPMGPIGLMCVQRTLNKGRWHGFVSGVGAALSDLIYASITCLGMGIIIDFVDVHRIILQIAGSILLLLFGFYTFYTNPSKSLHKPKEGANSFSQDAITAFFLTLSNPLIIFFYIALFARFNFIDPDETLYSIIIGLSFVVLGALAWWFLVSTLIGKLRTIINVRGLWIINKVVGGIIIFLSFLGIIYSILEYKP